MIGIELVFGVRDIGFVGWLVSGVRDIGSAGWLSNEVQVILGYI